MRGALLDAKIVCGALAEDVSVELGSRSTSMLLMLIPARKIADMAPTFKLT